MTLPISMHTRKCTVIACMTIENVISIRKLKCHNYSIVKPAHGHVYSLTAL